MKPMRDGKRVRSRRMNSVILNAIILLGITLNIAYTKILESEVKALKEWIELFWKIDFNRMSKTIRDAKKKGSKERE